MLLRARLEPPASDRVVAMLVSAQNTVWRTASASQMALASRSVGPWGALGTWGVHVNPTSPLG